MNKIIWGAVIGTLSLLTIFIFWTIESGTDVGSLSETVQQQRASASQTQVPYQSSVINTERQSIGAPLTEIQLSADDIKKADANGLIGAGYPFNNTYITKEELIAEIKEINPRFDALDEEYQTYIVTLRHLEKVESVTIENSKVGEVIETYLKQ